MRGNARDKRRYCPKLHQCVKYLFSQWLIVLENLQSILILIGHVTSLENRFAVCGARLDLTQF